MTRKRPRPDAAAARRAMIEDLEARSPGGVRRAERAPSRPGVAVYQCARCGLQAATVEEIEAHVVAQHVRAARVLDGVDAERAHETDQRLRGRAAANVADARAADERDLPRIVALFRAGDPVKTVMACTGISKERVTRLRQLAVARGLLPPARRPKK